MVNVQEATCILATCFLVFAFVNADLQPPKPKKEKKETDKNVEKLVGKDKGTCKENPYCEKEPEPLKRINDGACMDKKTCCEYWELMGECKRNAKWMKEACARSCKACKPKEGETEKCFDLYEKCVEWEKEGECKKNKDWMDEHCQKSCKSCGMDAKELKLHCGGLAALATKTECKDYYDDCKKWGDAGDCGRNIWWMAQNCPVTCKKCKPAKKSEKAKKA